MQQTYAGFIAQDLHDAVDGNVFLPLADMTLHGVAHRAAHGGDQLVKLRRCSVHQGDQLIIPKRQNIQHTRGVFQFFLVILARRTVVRQGFRVLTHSGKLDEQVIKIGHHLFGDILRELIGGCNRRGSQVSVGLGSYLIHHVLGCKDGDIGHHPHCKLVSLGGYGNKGS